MRAFLFPGQGSQHVGMAADLFRADAAFRELVALASAAAGEDLERLCLRGPDRRLQGPALLQPLLVAVSLGYARQLTAQGVTPAVVLGHSLGEISALGASGVLSPATAVLVAAQRGALMEQAAATLAGGMLAVTTSQRDRALARVTAAGLPVVLANDNAPGQFVLAGSRDALTQAGAALTRERLGHCQFLPVAGPWHSPHMDGARAAFGEWLAPVAFAPPRVPLVLNTTGRVETDPGQIKEQVIAAVAAPVQWRASMQTLAALGPRLVLEIGPGRVLAGLARANGIAGETELLGVGDGRAVERVVAASRAGHSDGGGK